MPNKILVVDDYRNYVSMLQKTLASEGFQTVAAYDGDGAIEKALAERPDLILLDIMMPKIGGTEVRVELMKHEETKNIPIIFLTGLRQPANSKKSPNGVPVIGKSNDFAELLAVIRQTLGQPAKK